MDCLTRACFLGSTELGDDSVDMLCAEQHTITSSHVCLALVFSCMYICACVHLRGHPPQTTDHTDHKDHTDHTHDDNSFTFTARRPTTSTRQRGNEATRQRGNEATRQRGNAARTNKKKVTTNTTQHNTIESQSNRIESHRTD